MNCKFTQDKLLSYIENDLSDTEKEGIKTHINSCKECSRLFSEISETYHSIGNEVEIEPKYYFAEGVLNKIHKEEELLASDTTVFDKLFSKYFREIAYSGVAFIILLFVFYYISEGTPLFNFMQDNDFLSVDNLSALFFD